MGGLHLLGPLESTTGLYINESTNHHGKKQENEMLIKVIIQMCFIQQRKIM